MSASLDDMLCLEDFEAPARCLLPRPLFDYISGGVEANQSLSANRSGVFALHDFPGLRSFLTPDEADGQVPVADDLVALVSPDEPRFRLTLHDTQGRYLDMALTPSLGQGLWGPWPDGSSPPNAVIEITKGPVARVVSPPSSGQ